MDQFIGLLLFLCVSAMASPGTYQPRLNVGMVFHEHPHPLAMGSEFLDLTIAIPYKLDQPQHSSINLSSLMDVLTIPFRGRVVNTEFPFASKLALELTNLTDDLYQQTFSTFSDINVLLSDPISPSSARTKRQAILTLECILLHTLVSCYYYVLQAVQTR
jgi:hypothetical protein